MAMSPNSGSANGFSNAVSVLASTSTSFGNSAHSHDESIRQAILEEEKALSKLKVRGVTSCRTARYFTVFYFSPP